MNPLSFRLPKHALAVAAALGLLLVPVAAIAAEQPRYPTPEAAVAALRAALVAGKADGIVAIFGDANRDLVVTADPDVDAATYAESLRRLDLFQMLDPVAEDRRVMMVGEEAWPFPIPIVKDSGGWRFASEQGREELLNRRIGSNELFAITVMTAYLMAQQDYASADRNGDGVHEYAQRIVSSPGQHDGLYWPADASKGEAPSPWGPLMAASAVDEKTVKQGDGYRGYNYRILKRQSRAAAGGSVDYVANGRMLGGFAMVAYPVVYGETGIMTFIVNRNGRMFQRDLGRDGVAAAKAMTEFDPGPGWIATVN